MYIYVYVYIYTHIYIHILTAYTLHHDSSININGSYHTCQSVMASIMSKRSFNSVCFRQGHFDYHFTRTARCRDATRWVVTVICVLWARTAEGSTCVCDSNMKP